MLGTLMKIDSVNDNLQIIPNLEIVQDNSKVIGIDLDMDGQQVETGEDGFPCSI